MRCQEIQNLMGAYVDGEIDLLRTVELDEHVKTCAACERRYEGIKTLRGAMTATTLRFRTPPDLEGRIRAQLRAAAGANQAPRRLSPAWLSVAAAIVLAGATALIVSRFNTANDVLAQEVLADHVRSLMATHLVDVLSTNQHIVKPWFDGKIDFAPVVNNFAEEGFPLYGGRLDYLDARPVAALVYQRHQHYINLFVWPSNQPESSPAPLARQGYNMVRWTHGGMAYWAVSDVSAADLSDFVRLQQGAATH